MENASLKSLSLKHQFLLGNLTFGMRFRLRFLAFYKVYAENSSKWSTTRLLYVARARADKMCKLCARACGEMCKVRETVSYVR